jgi:hypothetical protein
MRLRFPADPPEKGRRDAALVFGAGLTNIAVRAPTVSTAMGSDTVGMPPIALFVVTLVIVTLSADSPLPTVKPGLALELQLQFIGDGLTLVENERRDESSANELHAGSFRQLVRCPITPVVPPAGVEAFPSAPVFCCR